jgi:hypothetical protein
VSFLQPCHHLHDIISKHFISQQYRIQLLAHMERTTTSRMLPLLSPAQKLGSGLCSSLPRLDTKLLNSQLYNTADSFLVFKTGSHVFSVVLCAGFQFNLLYYAGCRHARWTLDFGFSFVSFIVNVSSELSVTPVSVCTLTMCERRTCLGSGDLKSLI